MAEKITGFKDARPFTSELQARKYATECANVFCTDESKEFRKALISETTKKTN